LFQNTSNKTKPVAPRYQFVEDDTVQDGAKKATRHRRKWNCSQFFWFWKVIATLGSIASMVAVTVILARVHSQPLDRCTLGISLNATIAIFITVGKSLALLVIGACNAQSKWIRFESTAGKLQELDLFESATRGPLGALVLLIHIR
jgi:hypothetical protein